MVRLYYPVSITSPTASESLDADFTVTGTATANVSVEVSVNGDVIDTVTADGSGNWSVDVTGQPDGAKTITATAKNTPLVYVGSFMTTDVRVFDTATDTQVAGSPFAAGTGLGYTTVSRDGSTIYATSANIGGDLFVLDTTTNTSVTYNFPGTSLQGLALSEDESLLYASDGGDNTIEVISTSDFTVVEQIDVGSSTNFAELSIDGSVLYLTSSANDNVYIVDLSDNSVSSFSLGTGSNAVTLATNNSGDQLYVSINSSPGYVVVVNTETNTVVDTVTVGNAPIDMAILPDDSKVYVTNGQENPGSVSVIDTATNTVTQTINVGLLPYGIDVTPDGSKVYVVCVGNIFDTGQEGGVWMIDTATDTATEIFETDDGSIGPLALGDFIIEESSSDTVSVTVSAAVDETETLADTGTNQSVVLFTSAILILGAGFVLRRYNNYA